MPGQRRVQRRAVRVRGGGVAARLNLTFESIDDLDICLRRNDGRDPRWVSVFARPKLSA